MKIEEIEKELDKKYKPLRFKGVTPKTQKEAIELMLDGRSTYLNSDKTAQCKSDCWRGVRDIYRVCKYYFPNTNLKSVMNDLKGQAASFCDETNQTVYMGYKYGNTHEIRVNIGRREAVEIEN